MVDDSARDAQDHGWRHIDDIERDYAAGRIDQAGWHEAMRALVEPAYLSAGTDRGGSGHSGTATQWRDTRGMVMAALDRDGSFLDVGCANGLLMESVHAWGAERGLAIEPYGVDISAALADLARRRLPHWADRIWAANAVDWEPPRRFDVVRTGVEYVPGDRLAQYLAHLLDRVVAPGGRLVVGKQNELRTDQPLGQRLADLGFPPTGRVERPSDHPDVLYSVTWIDRA